MAFDNGFTFFSVGCLLENCTSNIRRYGSKGNGDLTGAKKAIKLALSLFGYHQSKFTKLFRRSPGVLRDRSSGQVAITLICVLWFPLILIVSTSIWIQYRSQIWIIDQRTLDRCTFAVQKKRCERLSNIFHINKLLKRILKAAQVSFAMQANPISSPVAHSSLKALQATAKALALYQDQIVRLDSSASLSLSLCGQLQIPQSTLSGMQSLMQRRPQPINKLLEIPAPLEWKNPFTEYRGHLSFWVNGPRHTASYGSCQSQNEKIFTTFKFAPSEDKPQSRSLLRWLQ